MTKSESSSESVDCEYRWLILLLFCALEVANSLLCTSFAPISDITENYFGNVYGSAGAVNTLANISLVLYLPGTFLVSFSMKYLSLKSTLVIAGGLQFAGASIRYIASIYAETLSSESLYLFMLFGQSLSGIGRPTYFILPPAIAAIWFPVDERFFATSIGYSWNFIGSAVGCLIPSEIVYETDENGSLINGMSDLMLIEMIMCVVPLFFSIILLKSAPHTAPSQSTSLKNETREAQSDTVSSSYHFSMLLQNANYLILVVVFTLGSGFSMAILTVLNQIIQPIGYTTADAMTFSATFWLCGVAGIIASSFLMTRTRAYRPILKWISLCNFLAIVLFVFMLTWYNYWPLCISCGLMGFFNLPLVPVMMENCAECTYPHPEELSMGILFVGSSVSGLMSTFLLQWFLTHPSDSIFLSVKSYMIALSLSALLVLHFYQGEYIRLRHENNEAEKHANDPPSLYLHFDGLWADDKKGSGINYNQFNVVVPARKK